MNPILRPLAFRPVEYHGRQMWMLEDPLGLRDDQQLIFPYHLARMASRMDGSRTIRELHTALCVDAGEQVAFEVVDDTLRQLDEFYLLENERSSQALDRVMRVYLSQPYRPATFAGLSYPEDPQALHTFLQRYSTGDADLARWSGWNGRAIVSPHIDYQRGGHVYARTWQRARQAVEDAELIIIWGTDHSGGPASLTLSRLPYATPYGVLPTDETLVRELAAAIGEEDAYRLELNHRREHSIELVAVWLHHLRRENLCPVIPILVGSFHHLTPDGHPSDEPRLARLMAAVRRLTAGKRVLSVGSVDFAHVGPAFDSDYLVDNAHRKRLADADAQLRAAIRSGDRESFYRQLARARNADNVCGFSPLYMMLDYLGETSGQDIAYDQCSADADDTSVVTIAGMLLD